MKKNILISVCIALCGVIMLGFIEFMKAKNETKPENKYLKSDTTIKVKAIQTGDKQMNSEKAFK